MLLLDTALILSKVRLHMGVKRGTYVNYSVSRKLFYLIILMQKYISSFTKHIRLGSASKQRLRYGHTRTLHINDL